jgi:hypothetical protein
VALVSLLTIAELVRLRPYSIEDVRPINELRMVARWRLGRALAKVERGQGRPHFGKELYEVHHRSWPYQADRDGCCAP